MNHINSQLFEILNQSTEWRKTLHQHPQTSYEEVFASKFICEQLTKFGINFESPIAKTGVVGILKGKSDSGKKIALRADIDALNILEENELAYKSKYPGKMHACGHDGHTSMLLAAAKYLSETKNFNGTVYFIFQPAEEGGAGGDMMIKEGLFDKFPADSIWGMHNSPGLAVGDIQVKIGPMLASADEFEIKIIGQGGHAAMPHVTNDPMLVAANIISSAQSIISRNLKPTDAGVISFTIINGGSAFNIIPDVVTIKGTLRALNEQSRAFMFTRLEQLAHNIAVAYNTRIELIIKDNSYPVLINSEKETLIAEQVAKKSVLNVSYLTDPIMGAEDFAFMLNKKPGSYIFVGNGAAGQKGSNQLHTSKYDFNDDAAIYGVKYWINLVETILV